MSSLSTIIGQLSRIPLSILHAAFSLQPQLQPRHERTRVKERKRKKICIKKNGAAVGFFSLIFYSARIDLFIAEIERNEAQNASKHWPLYLSAFNFVFHPFRVLAVTSLLAFSLNKLPSSVSSTRYNSISLCIFAVCHCLNKLDRPPEQGYRNCYTRDERVNLS